MSYPEVLLNLFDILVASQRGSGYKQQGDCNYDFLWRIHSQSKLKWGSCNLSLCLNGSRSQSVPTLWLFPHLWFWPVFQHVPPVPAWGKKKGMIASFAQSKKKSWQWHLFTIILYAVICVMVIAATRDKLKVLENWRGPTLVGLSWLALTELSCTNPLSWI